MFVSGRGPVINWPLVSDTVSETVTENRRLDGSQSSLADIVFDIVTALSFPVVFPQSGLN